LEYLMTIIDTIRKMARRTVGVRADEVHGATTQQACVALQKLASRGEVHKLVIAHRHVRYFAHAACRDAYLLQLQERQREVARMGVVSKALGRRAPWTDDEPGIETEHTIYTPCPAFVPRFQAIELPVYGGNQRGRVMA
jgi:hypothetical protein